MMRAKAEPKVFLITEGSSNQENDLGGTQMGYQLVSVVRGTF